MGKKERKDRSKSKERRGRSKSKERKNRSKSRDRFESLGKGRRSRSRSPKKSKDSKAGIIEKDEEENVAKTKVEPLSLEELLSKKKAEEADKSKPKFLTKEE